MGARGRVHNRYRPSPPLAHYASLNARAPARERRPTRRRRHRCRRSRRRLCAAPTQRPASRRPRRAPQRRARPAPRQAPSAPLAFAQPATTRSPSDQRPVAYAHTAQHDGERRPRRAHSPAVRRAVRVLERRLDAHSQQKRHGVHVLRAVKSLRGGGNANSITDMKRTVSTRRVSRNTILIIRNKAKKITDIV